MRPGLTVAQDAELKKIDQEAVLGLLGPVPDSLAYKVHEIEKHFHNVDRWLGEHSSRSAEDDCGEINVMTPFQSDAENDGYGPWLCVIGLNDLPVQTGMVKYDLHHLVVTDVELGADLAIHKIQIAFGTGTAGDAYSAGQYTDVPPFIPERGAAFSVMDINMPRNTGGVYKSWLRHWVDSVNTGTMDFFAGIHAYPG